MTLAQTAPAADSAVENHQGCTSAPHWVAPPETSNESGGHGAGQKLALGADVPELGAKRDGDGESR